MTDNLNCKSVQKRIAIMKESEEAKTLRIEAKVGETAVRAFVEKLRERCQDHYIHSEGRLVNHDNPEEAWGVYFSANHLLDYAVRLLPKEEKEAI